MKIDIDPDVEKVMEFMLREIKGHKLVFVAQSVAKLTELAWANLHQAPDVAVRLSEWAGFPAKSFND